MYHKRSKRQRSIGLSHNVIFVKLLLTLLLLLSKICLVSPWSSGLSASSSSSTTTRREMLETFITSMMTMTTTTTTAVRVTYSTSSSSLLWLLVSPPVASAACLPGDLRKECIGVYKVPILMEDDDNNPNRLSSNYFSSKEALKRVAPDLQYVPPISSPKSLSSAMDILKTQQQLAANDIKDIVLAGRLEEAGIQILSLIPKVTTSGRYVFSTLQQVTSTSTSTTAPTVIDELKISMLEDQLNLVMGLFGECDVIIGQGLRGEMGVSAVAQLTILSSLRDATNALDDFLVLASKLLDETKTR
jgi:hypothetical protein